MEDAPGGQVVVKDAVELARLEGLEGHARAAEKRLLPA
jgi:histidinol dehydrogenase